MKRILKALILTFSPTGEGTEPATILARNQIVQTCSPFSPVGRDARVSGSEGDRAVSKPLVRSQARRWHHAPTLRQPGSG